MIEQIDSEILGRSRKVRIWSPDNLDPTTPCALLIQQDGQLAFTERDENLPFGSWGLDEWAEKLIDQGAIPPILIVGVDNSPKRLKEYFPMTEEFRLYERFLHEELLPWVGERQAIHDDPSRRAVMGSSMGGIVSFALAANRPDVFGACGCLSPWFEVEDFKYVREHLRQVTEKPPIRVYMDSGIRDWRGLDDGHRGMLMARLELLRLGFAEGGDLDWMVDTWFPTPADLAGSRVGEARHGELAFNQHNEYHWNRRLERPLRFLFG